jgi:exodeoxyribonuclease V alpha subunit
VRLALRAKVLVITGGPGVGKTTLVNTILQILRAKTPAIALAAPTGRAAKQMSEATGLEARTVHRLLEADLLVVDEMSMVDVPLRHALLKAVPRRAALLLVGDAKRCRTGGTDSTVLLLICNVDTYRYLQSGP